MSILIKNDVICTTAGAFTSHRDGWSGATLWFIGIRWSTTEGRGRTWARLMDASHGLQPSPKGDFRGCHAKCDAAARYAYRRPIHMPNTMEGSAKAKAAVPSCVICTC